MLIERPDYTASVSPIKRFGHPIALPT